MDAHGGLRIFLHDEHQVRDFLDHATGSRRIRLLNDLMQFSEAESADCGALALGAANGAADQLQAERFFHSFSHHAVS
jgi:hypothetical protein